MLPEKCFSNVLSMFPVFDVNQSDTAGEPENANGRCIIRCQIDGLSGFEGAVCALN